MGQNSSYLQKRHTLKTINFDSDDVKNEIGPRQNWGIGNANFYSGMKKQFFITDGLTYNLGRWNRYFVTRQLKNDEFCLLLWKTFNQFQDENSVQSLIDACITDEDKLYLCVSSPTIKDKPVQIRPWRLSDADFVLDASMPLDPRKTVFVGGVPRPLKAGKLNQNSGLKDLLWKLFWAKGLRHYHDTNCRGLTCQ